MPVMAESVKEVIERCGSKVAAAKEINVAATHIKDLEDRNAYIINGKIHPEMKRRGRE